LECVRAFLGLRRSAPIGIHSMRGEPAGPSRFFDEAEVSAEAIAASVTMS
jgi:hypothetical protein